MQVDHLSEKLNKTSDGYWKTDVSEHISYTNDGHNKILRREENSFWFSHRMNILSTIALKDLPEPIVDIGGGNGAVCLKLQEEGIDPLLLEPGEDGVKNALSAGVKNVAHSSLNEAGFKSESIGSILVLDVMEHIEKDEEFLVEISRILEQEGKLVLTVPAFNWLYSTFDQMVGHYRRYTLKELKHKIEKAGFQLKRSTYFFSLLPLPIYMARKVFRLNKVSRSANYTGHLKNRGPGGRMMKLLLKPELLLLRAGFRIPIGSSCLIIAEKVKK